MLETHRTNDNLTTFLAKSVCGLSILGTIGPLKRINPRCHLQQEEKGHANLAGIEDKVLGSWSQLQCEVTKALRDVEGSSMKIIKFFKEHQNEKECMYNRFWEEKYLRSYTT